IQIRQLRRCARSRSGRKSRSFPSNRFQRPWKTSLQHFRWGRSMVRIWAIIWKEFIQLFRDPKTLGMIVFMPVMQLMRYGYGIDNDVKHMSTIVYNEDQTPLSRRLLQALEQSSYFDIRYIAQSPQELRRALDRGKVKAALHIPPNFTRDLLAGFKGEIQLLIDGTDSNPANTALNTSQAIVTAFLQREGLVTAT